MINQNLLLAGDDGYNLTNSLRFRQSASPSLTRTPSTSGSQTTYTYSAWVKRGVLASANYVSLWASESSGANYTALVYYADAFYWSTNATVLTSAAVYRDVSAWYHIVLAVDTTQATSTNRVKIYVNGTEVALSGAYPSSSQALQINTSSFVNKIGFSAGFGQYFDGQMAEFNFVDGQQLTPSSFGETDVLTGVWKPKKFVGTYGTNGFYLPFTNTASTSTLGNDFSGNGNNLTVNNISLTAGTTYDSMTDVPTLTSATAANYPVWNPLDKASVTVTNGNLTIFPTVDTSSIRATMGLPLSGKFYWETTVDSLGYGSGLGIASASSNLTTGAASAETRTYQWGSWFNTFNSGFVQYGTNQGITSGNTWTSGASQLATNDVLMIAVDMDNGSMWVGKNGTWFNSSGTANPATNTDPRWTGLGGTTWFPYFSGYNYLGVTSNTNFGQRPFSYTPPTGFVALNTFNLPDASIKAGNKHFDATTYTGNGTGQSIVNSGGMQPDLVWLKSRSAAYNHGLIDSVRGINKHLFSNLTNAEATCSAGKGITALNSNGFTLGTESDTSAPTNENGTTFVGWQWKAGNSAGSSNTAGSITSTVSANTTAGFSVVTYTGTGSNATVGHGLGVAPSFYIVKCRSSTTNNYGMVYHASRGATKALYLSLSNAEDTASNYWQDTAPTSSVFSIGTYTGVNNSTQTYVAYCFAEVAGYSKFGSYTGNGSADGTFVYTGFRPKFLMVKRTDTTAHWIIDDSTRNTSNIVNLELYPSLSNAESSDPSYDFLSNGFKLRVTSSNKNASGGTYIYMAFAENPFKNSLAR